MNPQHAAEYRAFLGDIIAHPADDAPRLIFADWLEEHGEAERGEFVRVQCQLHATRCLRPKQRRTRIRPDCALCHPKQHYACKRCAGCQRRKEFMRSGGDPSALRRRARELLKAHWVAWSPGLGPAVVDDVPVFRRGFVAEVTCAAEQLLLHGDTYLWHPSQKRPCPPSAQPVERVRLTNWPPMSDHYDGFDCWSIEGLPGTVDLEKISDRREAAEHLLGRRFPGVAFDLPQ